MRGGLRKKWSELDLQEKVEIAVIAWLSVIAAALLALCVYKFISPDGFEIPSGVSPWVMWSMSMVLACTWIGGIAAVLRNS